MKKLIKNNTIHLIKLKAGLIYSFEQKEIKITELELEKFKDKISIMSTDTKADKISHIPEQVKKQEPKKEIKTGIINEHILDNYLGKNTRGILNDLEEDKEHLSDNDLKLLAEYEISNKNRIIIINKIKEMMNNA